MAGYRLHLLGRDIMFMVQFFLSICSLALAPSLFSSSLASGEAVDAFSPRTLDVESESAIDSVQSDEIYWETPQYLSRLQAMKSVSRYVYHWKPSKFIGHWIIPLNRMREFEGFSEIYEQAMLKYVGRVDLCMQVIPILNCLWNDVIFLSPIHPHKHFEEYLKIGFSPKKRQFFKIPIEILEEKRVAVWKWPHYNKYPKYSQFSTYEEMRQEYCPIVFSHYQEMDELPEDTKQFYAHEFDAMNPDKYPRFKWYRIPHILCQDPIDVSDPRITVIDWDAPIENHEE
jgi:hypothetical protein